ncbi:MAG: L,D-transpeptidase family protein [Actinomycetes bacterium]
MRRSLKRSLTRATALTTIAATVAGVGVVSAGIGPAAAATVPAPAVSCQTTVGGAGPTFLAKIGPTTKQVVVVSGDSRGSSYNRIRFWTKLADNCWVKVRAMAGRNGYTGWSKTPVDGSGLSPIGVFGLTDAGGRKKNPGSKLPYHYNAGTWDQYGYRMNSNRVQVFDYVVAINFNRFAGKPPRDMNRPNPKIHDGGIWFHVGGAGATRGCVSVTEAQMIWTLQWLDPTAQPKIIMGNRQALAR